MCPLRFLLTAIVLGLFGCTRDRVQERPNPQPRQLPVLADLKDIREAPEPIKKAAGAVVLIETEVGSGTAFFVSADGRMLTSNHVLGDRNCAREGCFVQVSFEYELGKPATPPRRLFAEPLGASGQLDTALFQVWTQSDKTQKFSAPHALDIQQMTSADLQQKRLHLVGHPRAGLKKWTLGTVFDEQRDWFLSTHLSLHGGSGSPFLNDQGNVVGISHRSVEGNEQIQTFDIRSTSVGTASSPLRRWMQDATPRHTQFFSVRDSVTDVATQFLNREPFYRLHELAEVTLSNRATRRVLDVLAGNCDEALAGEFTNSETVDARLASCHVAVRWMNCQEPDAGNFRRCPTGDEREQWKNRFQRASEQIVQFNRPNRYQWIVRPAHLENSQASFNRRAAQLLWQHTEREHASLNLELASYLVLYEDPARTTYQGKNLRQYILDFQNQPRYDFYYSTLLQVFEALFQRHQLSREEFAARLTRSYGDSNISVADRLLLEKIAYKHGLLH